ncbi:MAG TPA: hypothetical protein VJ251_20475, partial [Stellaceae bacterium]|nr:hypothetical protein [Stellaceae bacterium]
ERALATGWDGSGGEMDTSAADRGGGVNVLVGVYANNDVHGYCIGHCEHLQADCKDLTIGRRTGL